MATRAGGLYWKTKIQKDPPGAGGMWAKIAGLEYFDVLFA